MGWLGQQGCRGGHTSPVCPVTAGPRHGDAPAWPLAEESHNVLSDFFKVFSDHKAESSGRVFSQDPSFGTSSSWDMRPLFCPCPSSESRGCTVGRKLSRSPCADGRMHTWSPGSCICSAREKEENEDPGALCWPNAH